MLGDRGFVADLGGLRHSPLIAPGRVNSLSQALIKLTAPGVPDIYQGNELWDMSLVDPDNRRPVDYDLRRKLLGDLAGGMSPEEILRRSDEGPAQALADPPVAPPPEAEARAVRPGRGLPPDRGGRGEGRPRRRLRRGGGCVTVAVRLPLKLGGDWGDTSIDLPARDWSNELTGEAVGGGRVRLGELLKKFPVALLSQVRILNRRRVG